MTTTSSVTASQLQALTQGIGSAGTSSNSSSTSQVSQAYNTFVKMLTTQLKNQDPLNPTSTDNFTQELIGLSQVEQQLSTNQTLGSMLSDLSLISQSNGLGYVGKTVTASGATTALSNGSATWDYTLNGNANNTTLTVKDSSGNAVYSTSGAIGAGPHSYTWNGKTSNGGTLTSGDYSLVISAADSSGKAVSSTTSVTGKVTGVDTSSGNTELQIGDIKVPLASVTAIN